MKINKKKIFSALFFVAVFAFTIWTVFSGEDLENTLKSLKETNLLYLIPALLCVFLFVLSESVIIHYLLRSLSIKSKLGHCCLYSFIGFFYSGITPSASGGQPMQAVAMRKDDIPYAVSTVVLAIVTITYKLVLVLIGIIVLIIRPECVMRYLDGVEWIMYVGIGLNVVCVGGLLMIVFCPGVVKFIARKIFNLVNKIVRFKNFDKQLARVDRITEQYNGAAEYYRKHTMIIINVFIITLLQRFFLFLVTWFIYKAFGLSGESIIVIVLLQAMISVAADMLPLPGGMGVSENLFLQIFPLIFGEAVLSGMMISRGISFYTQLIICGIMTAVASFILKRKDDKEDSDEESMESVVSEETVSVSDKVE